MRRGNDPGPGLVRCPHCGQPTPDENLNCIYCGELLEEPVGPLTGLLYGWRHWLGALLVGSAVLAFLLWFF